MGNVETAQLQHIGEKGLAMPFQIELLDCISWPTTLPNERTGQTAWSSSQLAVQIRFVAPSTDDMPNLALVEGAKGFALQLTSLSFQFITCINGCIYIKISWFGECRGAKHRVH